MRVVALKAWSNGSISMEEKSVLEIEDALASDLIAQGIVAPTALPETTSADAGKVLGIDENGNIVPTDAGGVEGSNIFVAEFGYSTFQVKCNRTFAEFDEAFDAGKTIIGVPMYRADLSTICKVERKMKNATEWTYDALFIDYNSSNNHLMFITYEIDENDNKTRNYVKYDLTSLLVQ